MKYEQNFGSSKIVNNNQTEEGQHTHDDKKVCP